MFGNNEKTKNLEQENMDLLNKLEEKERIIAQLHKDYSDNPGKNISVLLLGDFIRDIFVTLKKYHLENNRDFNLEIHKAIKDHQATCKSRGLDWKDL